MGNMPSWGTDLDTNTLGLMLPPQEPEPCPSDQNDTLHEVPPTQYRCAAPLVQKRYMCKHMKRKGQCRLGSQCKFAHSRYELWIPATQFFQRRRVRLTPLPVDH